MNSLANYFVCGVSEARTVLAQMGTRADRTPGRWRAAAGMVGASIPYLLRWCAVLAITWDSSGPAPLAVGSATMLVYLLVGTITVRRRILESVSRASVDLPIPASMRPLLDRLGLRQLKVRIHLDGAPDRCYRLGRRAWIMLGSATECHEELACFVLWHEVAHLARRHVSAWRIEAGISLGLTVGAAVSLDVSAVAIAAVGTAMLTVAGRWWSELACDRFAVEQAGPEALHAWAAALRGSRRALRLQKKLPRRTLLKGLLTHPPLAMRTALHTIGE